MKKLILTVGLPRSGKSTWAKKQGLPIVSRDAIRLALHGRSFLYQAEAMVTAIENYMVCSLFYAGHNTVIVDATNLTQKRRLKWVSRLWEVELRVFSASAQTCVARAKTSRAEHLVPVIQRMSRGLDAETALLFKKGKRISGKKERG